MARPGAGAAALQEAVGLAEESTVPLQIEDVGDSTIVRFIDCRILVGPEIEELFPVVEQRSKRKFLLDFKSVEYMSSAVLGKLITLHKKVAGIGGQLALCRVIPQILELFKITKLDKTFRVQENDPDEDELLGGVKCRLIPPKPGGKDSVILPWPNPNEE